MEDVICAANELLRSFSTSARLLPQIVMEPIHFAVLMGLMVQLYKIYDTYILLIRNNRTEIALLLARSACDTAIDLSYLCFKPDKKKFDEFLRSSLAADRRVYNEVGKNKGTGYGNPYIQARIEGSIKSAFDAAGYKLEEVKPSDWKSWGKVKERAAACGMEREYIFVYGNLSRLTHGSWSGLTTYNLRQKEGYWYPNIDYAKPAAQSLEGISILVANAAQRYVSALAPNTEISQRLQVIHRWFLDMARKHEEYIGKE